MKTTVKTNGLILLIEIQNEALETVLTRKIKQNLKVARLALKGAKSCTLCKIIFIFVEVARLKLKVASLL